MFLVEGVVLLLQGDVVFTVRGGVFFPITVDLEGANIAESFDPAACLSLFIFERGTERVDGERLGVVAWGGERVREYMLPQLELPAGEVDVCKQMLASSWDP